MTAGGARDSPTGTTCAAPVPFTATIASRVFRSTVTTTNRTLQVIRRQVEQAATHGVHAFCHYHYWFDGKQLLETPTNLFLKHKELRGVRICLAWANETWSRRWDGQDHYILIQQTHIPEKERWERHFQYLIQAWNDERSLRINGKPIFLVYRPHRIEQLGNMFDYWQTRARSYGLPGLYFVFMNQYGSPDESVLKHFDAVMNFEPFVSYYALKDLHVALPSEMMTSRAWRALSVLGKVVPDKLPGWARDLYAKLHDAGSRPTLVSYDAVWREIVSRRPQGDLPVFPGIFMDWDNTARYGRRATVYHGASPERFAYWLEQLMPTVMKNKPEERLVFANAWNEWAEGAYLEPDGDYGYAWLDAITRVFGGVKTALRAP